MPNDAPTAYGGQVDRFLDRAPELPTEEDASLKPQVPFPTAYQLTREQEDILVEHALQRIEQLEREMGRVTQGSATAGERQTTTANTTTFLGKREIWTNRYYNHVEDRAEKGTIFEFSNLTASLSQRITMQMVARANNFFFGTDPWFAADFVGTEDRPLAEKIERHSRWKFEQTGLKYTMQEADEFAFVRGEAVLKTTHVLKEQIYKKKGEILIGQNGPILDKDGNPIFRGAAFVVADVPVTDPATGQPAIDPTTNAAASRPQTFLKRETISRTVLVADPATGQPVETQQVSPNDGAVPLPAVEQHAWQETIAPVRLRISEGPDCSLVFYKDFLCPLSARDIHDADLICHLYDVPVMTLVEMFQREALQKMADKEGIETMQRAVQSIRDMAGEGNDPKAAANQPRTQSGEQGNQSSANSPLAEVAECYLTYDADDDGIQEEIMLLVDRKNRRPIFYDYLANVTVKGRRPFEVIRAKAVDGRWYGMGAMEYFQPEQEFIDLLVNRINYRMSKSGSVTFWNPLATKEGQANPHLKVSDGETYTLVDGRRAEDALSRVQLPEMSINDLMRLLEFFMQLMQLKSGVLHAGDQEFAGLDSSKLATGIRNIEKSGQEMFAQFLTSLEGGQGKTLLANLRVLYANLNAPEVFRYFNGDTAALDTITPDEVADLDLNVTILMTRLKTEQMLESGMRAVDVVKGFYLELPVQVQQVVAPLYVDILKSLNYNNAKDYLQPMDLGIMPGGGGGAMATGQVSPNAAKKLDVPSAGTPIPEQSPALL